MTPPTHKELCALAVAWLQRPASRSGPGCTVAVSESANWINGEIPDAIGWRPYRQVLCGSVVVEVKVSRADFLADASKPHRIDGATGMGAYRYYLVPEGIIVPGDLPPKWGLVEVNKRGHLKVRAGHVLLGYQEADCWRHEHNQFAEISTLAMCLNRVADPQAVQDRIRDLSNRLSHVASENEKLKARNRELTAELFQLKHGDESTVATPRRGSKQGAMTVAMPDIKTLGVWSANAARLVPRGQLEWVSGTLGLSGVIDGKPVAVVRKAERLWLARIEGWQWHVTSEMGVARIGKIPGDKIKLTPVKAFSTATTAQAEVQRILLPME